MFFPILNAENDNIGIPRESLKTEEELRSSVAEFGIASGRRLFARIDDFEVPDIVPNHREISPPFDITVPDDNLYQHLGSPVPAGLYRAADPAWPSCAPPNPPCEEEFTNSPVADGLYLLVAPLEPGEHRIEFGDSSLSEKPNIYNLHVRPIGDMDMDGDVDFDDINGFVLGAK